MAKSIVALSLNAKNRQIDALLELTRVINNNAKAPMLFEHFRTILSDLLGIEKMVIFYNRNESWDCVLDYGVVSPIPNIVLHTTLFYFKRTSRISEINHPYLDEMEYVIPVYHKETPLAFALISKITPNEYGTVEEKLKFIETLTNITISAIENKRLFKRQLLQEGVKKELELAGHIQNMLIPQKFPISDKYIIDAIYQPHSEVGGDYYDFFNLPDNEIAFCIADISGKGMAAALLMSNFQATLRLLARQDLLMKEMVHRLNEQMYDLMNGEKFITMFFAKYNLKTKKLTYVNAGHTPPALGNNAGIQFLGEGTTILGSFKPLPHLNAGVIEINEPTTLFMFTDGLSELENDKHEYFGLQELGKFLKIYQSLTPKDFNLKLLEKINNFRGEMPIHDDISVLTCKFHL